jgi:hypothetical protein
MMMMAYNHLFVDVSNDAKNLSRFTVTGVRAGQSRVWASDGNGRTKSWTIVVVP